MFCSLSSLSAQVANNSKNLKKVSLDVYRKFIIFKEETRRFDLLETKLAQRERLPIIHAPIKNSVELLNHTFSILRLSRDSAIFI